MVRKAAKQKGITFGYCDVNTGQRVYPVPPASEMADLLPDQVPPVSDSTALTEDQELADSVHLNLTCSPALGQATIIDKDQHTVNFILCIETSPAKLQHDQETQYSIWHNHNGQHDWSDLHLRPVKPLEDVVFVSSSRNEHTDRIQLWYEGELSGFPKHGHAVRFSVKARVLQGDETFTRDATGMDDGVLLYHTQNYQKHADHDLKNFFSGTSSELSIKSERADTANTLLYSLTAPVKAADGKDSGHSEFNLGKPNDLTKWFAEVRIWAPWIAPRQGSGQFSLDKDAVLLAFLRADGMHVVVLAISGVRDVLTLFTSSSEGEVIIKARNERSSNEDTRVLIAVAESFEVANAAVFYHARKIVADNPSSNIDQALSVVDKGADTQWMEEWYDGFTFCTWNALGQDLTAEKIFHALDDLAKENIIITNLIIDDNWQSLSGEQGVDDQMNRGWTDFDANKKGFPDGLKGLTTKIRNDHPNIKHIAVWHALCGYWGGVSPDGSIAKNYKTIEVAKDSGSFHVVAAEDVGRMYDDFYRFLSSNGVDSVKTDAQFMIDEIKNAPDRKALITEYQDAWTIAHLRHLNSRAISCMSQTPQIMFHSQLPTNKPRVLVRNSDDFFPDVDSSHPWHVFCNAHNSVIAEHLNALPDWDMFQTSHKWASFHAAARCVSGGPIYFTDYPGHHNIKLIRQITAQTTRDTTIILRPDIVGRTVDPYNEYTSQALLKVGTFVGHAEKGAGILGLFNVAQRALREFVKLSDIPGTKTGSYIVHSFISGQVTEPMQSSDKESFLGVNLKTIGWDILTAHPVRTFAVQQEDVQIALLGLLNKMTGAAAVTGLDTYVETNGRLRVWASFKALGVVGLYVSNLPKKSLSDNLFVLLFGKPIPADCVRVNEVSDKVLEIDIEKAWKASNGKPGWSNEISIEVFVR